MDVPSSQEDLPVPVENVEAQQSAPLDFLIPYFQSNPHRTFCWWVWGINLSNWMSTEIRISTRASVHCDRSGSDFQHQDMMILKFKSHHHDPLGFNPNLQVEYLPGAWFLGFFGVGSIFPSRFTVLTVRCTEVVFNEFLPFLRYLRGKARLEMKWIPRVNVDKNYGNLPFIVDLPMKNGGFLS